MEWTTRLRDSWYEPLVTISFEEFAKNFFKWNRISIVKNWVNKDWLKNLQKMDRNFETDNVVNLHPTKRTCWHTSQKYFDCYVCPPQKWLTDSKNKKLENVFFSDEIYQRKETFSAAYCLNTPYPTKTVKVASKSAVLLWDWKNGKMKSTW